MISSNGWPGVIKVPKKKPEHDPLCPIEQWDRDANCECVPIRAGRASEREKIAQAIEASLVGATFANQYTIFAMQDAARIARNGGVE